MSSDEGTGRGRARRVSAWIAILVFTLAFAADAYRDKRSAAATDAAAPAADSVELGAALLLTRRHVGALPADGALSAELDALADGRLRTRLTVAVVGAELMGRAEGARRLAAARAWLDGALGDGRVLDPDDARTLEILDALYGGDGDAEHGTALAERADALPEDDRAHLTETLGPLGTLAAVPEGTAAPALRKDVLRGQWLRGYAAFAVAGFLCLLLPSGGLLFLVALVASAAGRVEWRLAAPAADDVPLVEICAAWLGIWAVSPVASVLAPDAALPISLAAYVLAPAALLLGRHRVPWSTLRQRMGWHRGAGVLREIGAGLVAYVASLPIIAVGVAASLLLSRALEGSALPSDTSHPITEILGGAGPLRFLAVLLIASGVAPLVEETLFRGLLYRHLRSSLAGLPRALGVAASALLTALLFAAMHPQSIGGIPMLTGIGVAFALTREWRDSLIAPMVVHGVSNGLVATVAWMALG